MSVGRQAGAQTIHDQAPQVSAWQEHTTSSYTTSSPCNRGVSHHQQLQRWTCGLTVRMISNVVSSYPFALPKPAYLRNQQCVAPIILTPSPICPYQNQHTCETQNSKRRETFFFILDSRRVSPPAPGTYGAGMHNTSQITIFGRHVEDGEG